MSQGRISERTSEPIINIELLKERSDLANWAARNNQPNIIHYLAELNIYPDQESINYASTQGDRSVLQALSQYGKYPQTKRCGYLSPRFHYYDETYPRH